MGAIPDNSHSSFSFVVSAFLSCLHYRAARQFPPSTFSLILLLHRFPPITPVVTRCSIFSLLITRPKKRVCLVLILLIRYILLIALCLRVSSITSVVTRCSIFSLLITRPKKRVCRVLILLIRYPIDCTLFERIIYHFVVTRCSIFSLLNTRPKNMFVKF